MTAEATVAPSDLSRLAPDYVRGIARYIPGKPIEELAREFGLDPQEIVKLASNENPRGPGPAVRKAIAEATDELSRYPDGNGFALKSALAARLEVDRDDIVLGNGSNDVLELVTQAFLRPGDSAVYSRHAFAVYPLATQARGATGIEVAAAKDYGHDLPAMRAAIKPTTRVVFVANPNNPTGTWIAPDVLRSFVATVPADVLRGAGRGVQRVPRARAVRAERRLDAQPSQSRRVANVLEGLRTCRVARWLRRHERGRRGHAESRAPALQRECARAGSGAGGARRRRLREESRALNREGRAVLEQGFAKLGLAFVPSHANFVLVKVGDAARVYEHLLRQGVIVRPVANYGLPEWLRVTIGVGPENRRFLDALAAALAG